VVGVVDGGLWRCQGTYKRPWTRKSFGRAPARQHMCMSHNRLARGTLHTCGIEMKAQLTSGSPSFCFLLSAAPQSPPPLFNFWILAAKPNKQIKSRVEQAYLRTVSLGIYWAKSGNTSDDLIPQVVVRVNSSPTRSGWPRKHF
jgi:hypothetical protein